MKSTLPKKLLSMVLSCVLFAVALNVTVFANDIQVRVNGNTLMLVNKPVNLNGVTLVPISDVLNGMGYTTVFYDSQIKELTMGNNNAEYSNKIVITSGKSNFMFNGKSKSLGGTATIINGTIYTPIPNVVAAIGYKVIWSGATIIVYTDNYLNGLLKSTAVFTPDRIGIYVNGYPLQLANEPHLMHGIIYVPIAEVLANLGYDYVWFHSAQEITIGNNDTKKSNKFVIKRWQKKFTYNGKSYDLNGTADTIDNVMYTPLPSIMNVVGHKVIWVDGGLIVYNNDYAAALLKK